MSETYVNGAFVPERVIFAFAAHGLMRWDTDAWSWTDRGRLWLTESAAAGHRYGIPFPPFDAEGSDG